MNININCKSNSIWLINWDEICYKKNAEWDNFKPAQTTDLKKFQAIRVFNMKYSKKF